jgi:cytochrome c553
MKLRVLLVSLLIGCGGGDVPSDPTYFSDVQPILRANCARCHGADPYSPKTTKFRLDRYVKDDTATYDAYDYATGDNPDMLRVAVAHEAPAMPPDYTLSERQQTILTSWVAHGAPKGTRANQAPQLALVSPQGVTTVDQTLDVTFRAWDGDLDGLVVQLWAHDQATTAEQDVPLAMPTGAGTRAQTIDAGQLASKHVFEIYAKVDDGFFDDPTLNQTHATLIPMLAVDHGARGTAPTVALVAPNGGETLIGSATIQWTATDPDPGDKVTIDLALMRVAADLSETVAAPIATGLANTGSYTWAISASLPATDSSGAAISYRVRVTGTDTLGVPPNVRSDESDGTVTIAQPTTTTLTWADVKPTFTTYCGACHDDPAKTVAINYFCLLEYKLGEAVPPCGASDEGVFEMKTTVYQKLVTDRSMPPAASPQPSSAERANVGNWILGGAPYGSGPADPPPTFTWNAPSATQSSGATAMLSWSAMDAGGITGGKLEYTHLNGIPSTGCASVTNATWTAIAGPQPTSGSMTWTSTFSWSILNPTGAGYYCVRGSVTDTANQTTLTVNPYGLK